MSYSYQTGWDVQYERWAELKEQALNEGMTTDQAEAFADRQLQKETEA